MNIHTLWLVPFFFALSAGAAPPAGESARYRFTYQVHLDLPGGKAVRLWLPVPARTPFQTVEKIELQSPIPGRETAEKRFGNRLLYFEGTPADKTLDLTVTSIVTRLGSRGTPHTAVKKGTPTDPDRYLEGDSRAPLADKIRAIARHETKPGQSNRQKIRALYNYVVRTMAYDKSGTGWGEGDAIWACANRRGNCTDFHSLFIALNRTLGIPARFFIGFPIPTDQRHGAVAGYHCWAEAFDSKSGWIPVDASEAKKSGDAKKYFGYLPNDRIEFSAGRDLVLEPPQKGAPLNYFIYPYAEVEGAPLGAEKISRKFTFDRL